VRLIFLNRYFHPDHSATSQMLSDLAFALKANGLSVQVITSRQRYELAAAELPRRECIAGVDVERVWTSRFGRRNLVGRGADYATFYCAAGWRLWRHARKGDVVVAKTDPPMLSVVVAPLCWLRRAKLINWLQDVFPETAAILRLGGVRVRAIYALLRLLRNRSLRAAVANVVPGERVAEHLKREGIRPALIRTIPNWADGSVIEAIDLRANRLRAEWGLSSNFVVGYSGNLGRAHDIATLLEAIAILERQSSEPSRPQPAEDRAVRWLFIGGGALLARLQEEVARRALTSVLFKPIQPRERLSESLSTADVHLVSLRPELEGLIVPSKFYGIAAAGRPTIFVGDTDGEIARLISRHQCGCAVAMGDGRGLAQAIRGFAADPEHTRAMGVRARQAFAREFDKPIAVAKWRGLFDELAKSA
jgi:glycosyltransferase involved in cell wall biosynthesis